MIHPYSRKQKIGTNNETKRGRQRHRDGEVTRDEERKRQTRSHEDIYRDGER